MIPETWYQEKGMLAQRRHDQRRKDYVWQPDEEPVTQEMLDALDHLPVTEEELAEIADGGRGQYSTEDTRIFVIAQETACQQNNCWMVREADGKVKYISQHPDEFNKLQRAAAKKKATKKRR